MCPKDHVLPGGLWVISHWGLWGKAIADPVWGDWGLSKQPYGLLGFLYGTSRLVPAGQGCRPKL